MNRAGDDRAGDDLGGDDRAGDALSTGVRSALRVSRARWRTIANILAIILALALLQATTLLLIQRALADSSVTSGSDPRGTVYAPLLNERFTGGPREDAREPGAEPGAESGAEPGSGLPREWCGDLETARAGVENVGPMDARPHTKIVIARPRDVMDDLPALADRVQDAVATSSEYVAQQSLTPTATPRAVSSRLCHTYKPRPAAEND